MGVLEQKMSFTKETYFRCKCSVGCSAEETSLFLTFQNLFIYIYPPTPLPSHPPHWKHSLFCFACSAILCSCAMDLEVKVVGIPLVALPVVLLLLPERLIGLLGGSTQISACQCKLPIPKGASADASRYPDVSPL